MRDFNSGHECAFWINEAIRQAFYCKIVDCLRFFAFNNVFKSSQKSRVFFVDDYVPFLSCFVEILWLSKEHVIDNNYLFGSMFDQCVHYMASYEACSSYY